LVKRNSIKPNKGIGGLTPTQMAKPNQSEGKQMEDYDRVGEREIIYF